MSRFHVLLSATIAAVSIGSITAANAGEQEAIDGCIDKLRGVGGPDGQSGEVLSSDFSEAATIVMLKDRGGTVWRCHAYSDGSVDELSVAEAADDSQGAVGGAGGEQRVSFPSGTSGTELTGTLSPGESMRYLLGAKEGQFFYVRVAHRDGPRLDFQIFNPDGSFLLELIPTDKEYNGQLWQSGDHVVEVVNRGGAVSASTDTSSTRPAAWRKT
jgi:hypothetical protein